MASGIRQKIDISAERVYCQSVAKKMGRPTKQVPRTLARLEEALSKGLPRWAACAYAKISRQCFNEWLQRPEFEAQVLEWEAASMAALVAGVKKEPRGKQFLLARRFRDDYGDKVEIEQSGHVEVRWVDDWRPSSKTPPPTQWADPSTTATAPAQHPGRRKALEENDSLSVDSD